MGHGSWNNKNRVNGFLASLFAQLKITKTNYSLCFYLLLTISFHLRSTPSQLLEVAFEQFLCFERKYQQVRKMLFLPPLALVEPLEIFWYLRQTPVQRTAISGRDCPLPLKHQRYPHPFRQPKEFPSNLLSKYYLCPLWLIFIFLIRTGVSNMALQ